MQYASGRPTGLASLIAESSPASVPDWMPEVQRLRSELPPEVEATLREHEEAGTTDDPAYQAAEQEFYKRHLCRVEPWPDWLVECFSILAANPEVYHAMNGPSEFHVIGTIKDWDITERLGQIEAPTLVFSGRYDEVTPAITEAAPRDPRLGVRRARGELPHGTSRGARAHDRPRARLPRPGRALIETARLRLVPWPVELFEALPSRESAGAVLGAAVPEGWPDEELQGLLEVYEPRLRNDPTLLGFGPWVAIAAGEVVGSAGFVGGPNERGEVELGYGILEGHRNRGYATEAARALVAWALTQPTSNRSWRGRSAPTTPRIACSRSWADARSGGRRRGALDQSSPRRRRLSWLRRRFCSSRRSTAALLGLVGRRRLGTRSASRRASTSLSVASSRLRHWLRSSWATARKTGPAFASTRRF